METPEILTESLALERIEVNTFRGVSPEDGPGRIFGGQVIAQSLLAAYETVEERICHSLHCYFIRPGDPRIPILFEVDRSRDGGTFTTRRVIAVQNGKQIFNLAASFQVAEDGFEHQAPMPAVRSPDDMAAEADAAKKAVLDGMSEEMRRMMNRPRPIEMVGRDNYGFGRKPKPSEPKSDTWMRAVAPIGDDARMHQVILAYASDMNLLSTAMRPHGVAWQTPGLQSASLDHAMWFHKPSNFNDWHLYTQDSPSASGGRGFVRGAIYGQDGTLVASVAQEGLMRLKK
ncbi:acyl-CoA thioesterase II [Phenylobacterium sp. Root77]|jgi:acyl-CoA thioesterase-2|uniref:acyl-CoA thioesterase n=1 Tax=unclassified Phenylobacterium TaxID=2640670 RepID=UPI0006FF2C69|nr:MULTISPECIES: acyl-CoA thioesterase II [unclassified Phenylobacterium]KQW65924.1 acyl-CoA thioesterase II [Phenylobacterium sp. Root1277]KQW95633.1 acyl-CoA thioesterase II [Phenylobacterium sp. Root1290]KRC41422.1 acyl-CoA thioesterase II [Phenylobacterium sp. Root77]